MLTRILALVLVLSFPASAEAEDIVGSAIVTDGDSLIVDGISVRLCGIDSVEKGDPGYDEARVFLRDLATWRTVRCVRIGEGSVCDGRSKPTSYHRVIAQCFLDDIDMGGDIDLAAELVKAGHACAWPVFSGDAYRDLGCVTERETTNAVDSPAE